MIKTSKFATGLAVLAVLGVSGTAAAASPEGFYLGGSALQSRFDSDNFDVDDVDDEDTGWKAIAGFKFTPNWAIEGTYTRFGNAEAPVPGDFSAKAKAFSVFGVGIFPAGPVDLFLKAGASRLKAEGNIGETLIDDKKTEFAYGAGAQFNLGKVGFRAEYEKYDTDVIGDLDVISLGVVFTFGAT